MKKIVELKMEKDYIKVFDASKLGEIDREILNRSKKYVKIENEEEFLSLFQTSDLIPLTTDFDTYMLEEYIKADSDINFILRRMINEQTKGTMDDFIAFFNNLMLLNGIVYKKDMFSERSVMSLSNDICNKFNELFDN